MLTEVREMLDASGVLWSPTKFTAPPKQTYIAAFESLQLAGPDLAPALLVRHDVTLELYAYKIDLNAEAAIESAMTARKIAWTKSDREWIEQEKLYQTVYNFYHMKKGE